MEWEHCIRGGGEDIQHFLHRIKGTVDKGWPDDMNGIEAAQQNKMKRLPKSMSALPETITESEDHAMDKNNGLETKFFREEINTTLTMDP